MRLERAREGRGYHEAFVHRRWWFPPTQGFVGVVPVRGGTVARSPLDCFASRALPFTGALTEHRVSGAAESGRAAFAASSAVPARLGTRETGRSAR